MSSWFVRPEISTLALSDGHSLTVRKRLNTGERRAAFKRMSDPQDSSLALVTAYLLDWSLTEFVIRDKPVEDVTAALDNLDPERFNEIATAINVHVGAMRAERELEKNVQGGKTPSAVTSHSLSDADGPSTQYALSTATTTTSL